MPGTDNVYRMPSWESRPTVYPNWGLAFGKPEVLLTTPTGTLSKEHTGKKWFAYPTQDNGTHKEWNYEEEKKQCTARSLHSLYSTFNTVRAIAGLMNPKDPSKTSLKSFESLAHLNQDEHWRDIKEACAT